MMSSTKNSDMRINLKPALVLHTSLNLISAPLIGDNIFIEIDIVMCVSFDRRLFFSIHSVIRLFFF